MNIVITVEDLKGAIHCPECGTQVLYDLCGRPPRVAGTVECQCGKAILVKLERSLASLGPSEVKDAHP